MGNNKEFVKNILDDPGFVVLAASVYAISILGSEYVSQYSVIATEFDKFISGMYSF